MKNAGKRIFKYPLILIYGLVGMMFREDERIARRLRDYFPTYRAFFIEFLNQFLRCIGSPRSFLPQGLLIEPTNCCNLRCRHCTPQVINEKRGYIDYGFYKKILDDNPQLICLILTMNGEPFLHPRIFDMIKYARDKNVYVAIYTNGVLLGREKADRVLDAGLNELIFSLEGIGEEFEKNRGASYDLVRQNMIYLVEARDTRKSELKIGINIARIDDSGANIRIINEAWGKKVDYIDTEPLMGRPAALRRASCRTLWRNAVVRWDGIVIPCCLDMENTLIMGDLKKNTLKEIFNGPEAVALRKSHLKGEYPPVCKYCSTHFG